MDQELSMAIPPFYGLLKKFREQEFDIIHTHTPFTIGYVGLRWGNHITSRSSQPITLCTIDTPTTSRCQGDTYASNCQAHKLLLQPRSPRDYS